MIDDHRPPPGHGTKRERSVHRFFYVRIKRGEHTGEKKGRIQQKGRKKKGKANITSNRNKKINQRWGIRRKKRGRPGEKLQTCRPACFR